MIRTFQANRSEFEHWKDVFKRTDQNCRVERTAGVIGIESSPCVINDKERLSAFMDKPGITSIEARWDTRHAERKDGAVIFVVFSEAMSIAGQDRQFEYDAEYHGALEKRLDHYNWGLLKRTDELPTGFWVRKIEDNWYLNYNASL